MQNSESTPSTSHKSSSSFKPVGPESGPDMMEASRIPAEERPYVAFWRDTFAEIRTFLAGSCDRKEFERVLKGLPSFYEKNQGKIPYGVKFSPAEKDFFRIIDDFQKTVLSLNSIRMEKVFVVMEMVLVSTDVAANADMYDMAARFNELAYQSPYYDYLPEEVQRVVCQSLYVAESQLLKEEDKVKCTATVASFSM